MFGYQVWQIGQIIWCSDWTYWRHNYW